MIYIFFIVFSKEKKEGPFQNANIMATLIRLFNGLIALRSKSLGITATKAMGSKASCHLLRFSSCQDEENRVFPR